MRYCSFEENNGKTGVLYLNNDGISESYARISYCNFIKNEGQNNGIIYSNEYEIGIENCIFTKNTNQGVEQLKCSSEGKLMFFLDCVLQTTFKTNSDGNVNANLNQNILTDNYQTYNHTFFKTTGCYAFIPYPEKMLSKRTIFRPHFRLKKINRLLYMGF